MFLYFVVLTTSAHIFCLYLLTLL